MPRPDWQILSLLSETPRPADLLSGLDLMRGLRGHLGFGLFAMIYLVLGPVALMTGSGIPLGPILMSMLIFTSIGGGFLYHVRRQHNLRRQALLMGQAVEGNIIRHGTRFNLFGSTRHRTVTALFLLPDHQQSATGVLFKREVKRELAKGSRLIGLWLPDQNLIWLPLEIGLKLEAEVLEQPERVLAEIEE